MPATTERQEKAMQAAAHGHSTLGIPKSVGEEFVKHDSEKELKLCAGILFRANGKYLVLKRDDKSWDLPGGHLEDHETPVEGAIRETDEEAGIKVSDNDLIRLRTNVTEKKEYTTYLCDVPSEFKPKLNDEHTDYAWTIDGLDIDDLHPEIIHNIQLLSGNELDLANRVRNGELDSPQKYQNIWLFDVRITGTGTSYRSGIKEHVYRPPENFLSPEFLERCIGLPLIFDHPEQSPILNTEEFRERSIGTVIMPYVKDDEVWGIAKVYDDDAARLMMTTHTSTSPGVVLGNKGDSQEFNLDDGNTLLIEGDPSYLDHLAVCEAGVWDKGGDPSGINLGDVEMSKELLAEVQSLRARLDAVEKNKPAEELEIAADARKDGESDEDYNERMDSEDKERKDSEEEPERKDSEDERCDSEKEEERADSDEEKKDRKDRKDRKDKRMDSISRENKELRKQMDSLQALLSKVTSTPSHTDMDQLSAAQARADGVAQMFGERVSAPMVGENPIDYRKRLAAKFQKHSEKMKGVRLDSLSGASFDLVEEKIYDDAKVVALNPNEISAGRLIPQVRQDAAGRNITTFTGDIGVWMTPFMGAGIVGKINKDHKGA